MVFSATDETNKKNYLEGYDVFLAVGPQGTSNKSIQHFIKNYNSKETESYFTKFDHGEAENMKRYFSPKPPKYDLSAITGKVILYFGTGDLFVTKEGVEKLKSAMSGANVSIKWLEEWGHISFMMGNEMKEFYTGIFEEHIKKKLA